MNEDTFDWSTQRKEKYYKRLDEVLLKIKNDMLETDRSRFGVREGKIVKVYIKRFRAKGNEKAIARLKKYKNFHEVNRRNKEYGRMEVKFYYDGWFEFDLEEELITCT